MLQFVPIDRFTGELLRERFEEFHVPVIPTEVEESLTISEISRDVSRSTRCARSGRALNMAAAPLLNGCNVTLPLDMTMKEALCRGLLFGHRFTRWPRQIFADAMQNTVHKSAGFGAAKSFC